MDDSSKVTTLAPEVTGPSTHTLFKPVRSRIRYIVSSSSLLNNRNVTSTTTDSSVAPVNKVSIATTLPSSNKKQVNLSIRQPSKTTTVATTTTATTTSKPPTTKWDPEEIHRIRVPTSKNNKASQEVTHAPNKLSSNSGYNPFDDSGYGYGHDTEHLYPSRSTYAPYVYGSSNNLPEEEGVKKSPVLAILNREAINNWAKDVLTYFYAPFLVPAAISNALTNAPDGVEHETLFGRTVKSLKTFFAKPQVRKDTGYESQAQQIQPPITSNSNSNSNNSTSTNGLISKLKNTGAKWYNKLITLPKVTIASLRKNSTVDSNEYSYNGTDVSSQSKELNSGGDGNLNYSNNDEAVNE